MARSDGNALTYVGAVGTGLSDAFATMLRTKLDAIATPKCAVAGLKTKGTVWVQPKLKEEIARHDHRRRAEACILQGIAGRLTMLVPMSDANCSA